MIDSDLKMEYCEWLGKHKSWAFPEIASIEDQEKTLITIPGIKLRAKPMQFSSLKQNHQRIIHNNITNALIALGCAASHTKSLHLQRLLEV